MTTGEVGITLEHVAAGYGDDGPVVSVRWLQNHLIDPGLIVVDPRSEPAYAAAHLPGAVHIDLNRPDLRLHDSSPAERDRFHAAAAAAFGQVGVGLDPAHPVDPRQGRVVFTEEISGTLAARGVWLLDYLGHGQGAMLDGGLHAWAAAGGALTRDVPDLSPALFVPALVPDLLATADEIRDAVASPGPSAETMAVLDTRAIPEYAMATIPTAIHLEWVNNLGPDGALRPAAELRALYAAAGVSTERDRRVVTFCGSGFRAAQTYVVLRALGITRVANYAPSWGEWGRRPDLPTVRPSIDPFR